MRSRARELRTICGNFVLGQGNSRGVPLRAEGRHPAGRIAHHPRTVDAVSMECAPVRPARKSLIDRLRRRTSRQTDRAARSGLRHTVGDKLGGPSTSVERSGATATSTPLVCMKRFPSPGDAHFLFLRGSGRLDMSPESLAHGGQHLFRECVLLPGSEPRK